MNSRDATALVKRLRRALDYRCKSATATALMAARAQTADGNITQSEVPAPTVAITSYGSRLNGVHRTIESIARGDLRPRRLILTLTREDYDRTRNSSHLRRLEHRGLEVLIHQDTGPHKKYQGLVRDQGFNNYFVIADDDVVYPQNWLRLLEDHHIAAPDCIWSWRTFRWRFDSDGRVAPYASWQPTESIQPSFANLATGVGGVLYPAGYAALVRDSMGEEMRYARRADDFWLNAIAVRCGIRTGRVTAKHLEFPENITRAKSTLSKHNVLAGGNDDVIAQLYGSQLIERIMEDL